jgi:hypothetical protein
MQEINADITPQEINSLISEYDREESDSLSLLEFQKIVVNLVGIEWIEKLNCRHLSNISTDYTDTQKQIMKSVLTAFENRKLPLSRQFQLFVKHSPNDRVTPLAFGECLQKEYNLQIPQDALEELIKKFDVHPDGLSRASFTKFLSTSRVV